MDFEKRLQQAIDRGRRSGDDRAQEAFRRALSEEELRRLHAKFRLELSEQIEKNLHRLPDHFPGFRFETVADERGWGAGVSRDNVRRGGSAFSRLEMVVRPFTGSHVIELAAKGTVNNKEVFNRSHYQKLAEADLEAFHQMIDLWTIEFAERFAAGN